MTRFCPSFPELVGPGYWLPPEPFEFGWAYGVGCNSLRCEQCDQPVRSEVVGEHRRYTCACQNGEETGVYRIGAESMDLYPVAHFPRFTEWVCGGHPDFVLPALLDGVRLDGGTDWEALVTEATSHPPFEPPGVELNPVWIVRLHQLLTDERPLVSEAVAGLLDNENPVLVRAAYDFFGRERDAAGAEHIVASVAARRAWLATAPDPQQPGSVLLDRAAVVLHGRLPLDDETELPVDGPEFEMVKELALTGAGPTDAPFSLHDGDPEWVWTHAATLASANREWVDSLVYLLMDESGARREQVVRDIAAVAPDLVREAIDRHFEEPERGILIALAD